MFSIGAGYSGQDNLAFVAEISQQNFLGRGQTLKLKTSFFQYQDMVRAAVHRALALRPAPLQQLERLALGEGVGLLQREFNGRGIHTGISPLGILQRQFRLHVFDRYHQGHQCVRSPVHPGLRREYRTGIVSIGINRDTTDDNFFPTRGSRNGVSVGYASKFLGGTTSYVKAVVQSQWFFGLPLDTVFSVRGRAGYLAPSEGESIPLFERFTLGGMNSLRGLKDVGPKDATGYYVIGGTSFLCFNVEYLFPLVKEAGIKGVVFYDTGNAWDTYTFGSDFRHTTGAGIRWYSPLGPCALSGAMCLTPRKANPRRDGSLPSACSCSE